MIVHFSKKKKKKSCLFLFVQHQVFMKMCTKFFLEMG